MLGELIDDYGHPLGGLETSVGSIELVKLGIPRESWQVPGHDDAFGSLQITDWSHLIVSLHSQGVSIRLVGLSSLDIRE